MGGVRCEMGDGRWEIGDWRGYWGIGRWEVGGVRCEMGDGRWEIGRECCG